MDSVFNMLGVGFGILDFGFWILDLGFWILDSGFWVLDFGFLILDFGFWISGFRIFGSLVWDLGLGDPRLSICTGNRRAGAGGTRPGGPQPQPLRR